MVALGFMPLLSVEKYFFFLDNGLKFRLHLLNGRIGPKNTMFNNQHKPKRAVGTKSQHLRSQITEIKFLTMQHQLS